MAGSLHFAPGKGFLQSNILVHDMLGIRTESFNVSSTSLGHFGNSKQRKKCPSIFYYYLNLVKFMRYASTFKVHVDKSYIAAYCYDYQNTEAASCLVWC